MENLDISSRQTEEDGIDFGKYLFLFLRNWYWLVLGGALGLSIAWFQLRYATTIYKISSKVLIFNDDQSSVSEAAIIEDLGFSKPSNVLNEMQILKSSNLMEKVVDTLKINISYFEEGRIKITELYRNPPITLNNFYPENKAYGKSIKIEIEDNNAFYFVENEKDTTWCKFGKPFVYKEITLSIDRNKTLEKGNTFLIKIQDPRKIARRYANRIDLDNQQYSDVISLELEDASPRKAIDILEALVNTYNTSVIEQKNISGNNTLTFIDDRLKFISRELFDVEKEVEDFRRSKDLPTEISARASEYLKQVSIADEKLTELSLKESLINQIEVYLTIDSNNYKSLPVVSEVLEGQVNELVVEYNNLIFDRNQKLEAATPENPLVITYDEKISYLKTSIQNNLEILKSSLRQKRAQIQGRINPIEAQISSIPSYERQFLQIMRQQQIKEQLFLYLLQKREETALSIAAQVGTYRVLDRPFNRGPVSPNRNRIFIFYLALGLGLPTGIILLRDILDTKIYSRQDVEKLTKTPFVGIIAKSNKDDVIVVKKKSRSSIGEMFRLLRTNISFLNKKGKKSLVTLITSSVSGEGKTFITINLGLAFAYAGKKTVLLGLDLRKPKLSKYIAGTTSVSGLSNYIMGEAKLSDIIHTIEGVENIDYIGSGPIPPNPSELLMREELINLINVLREKYDVILLDTAPVGLVTDAFLLQNIVDNNLIVTRQGLTEKGALKLVDEVYQESRMKNLGLILNGVDKNKGYYGYGYGYDYGYGYGYGYFEESKKKHWWKFW